MSLLSQLNPSAGVDTLLYTVPGGKKLSIPVFNIASISSSTVQFSIAIVPSGETLDVKHWLNYGCDFETADAFRDDELKDYVFPEGTKIYVRASTNELAFHLYGREDLE